MTKGINGVHDSKITAGRIWEESTHRDGAIYKKNWGFYGSGCPIDLTDRRETDLESYKSSKVSPCYPYPGNCTRHPREEMILRTVVWILGRAGFFGWTA